jgi:hypothetical protein
LMASTKKAGLAKMQRVSKILAQRYSGMSLADIGAEEGVTPQAIHALIQRALGQIPQSSTADIRLLECSRLDVMTEKLWPAVLMGDLGAITTVLKIMCRRAAMMGLDLQRGSSYGREDGETDGERVVRVEIIGNPEPQRVKWLEDEVIRLRALSEGSALPSTTLN